MLNRMYKQFDRFVYKVNKTVVHHWKGIFFRNVHVEFHCHIFYESNRPRNKPVVSSRKKRKKKKKRKGKKNSRDRKRKQNRIEFALPVFTVIDLKVTSI